MKDMTGETSEPRLPPATRGFKPYPAYKDSGFEWLAKIPAHWDVKRLWHLTPFDRRIMYGIVLPGPNVEDGVPIVKGGDVSPERLRLARLNRTTFEIESGHVRSRLRGGDLVYAIRGSIGEVAIVPDELEGANLTQDAARIAYTSATHGSWLLHALKSAAVFAQLEAGALGATISGINIRDLKRASIPVPPRAEQETIATFLGRETARIDGLVVKKKRLIELLQEKRAALITRAVSKGLDLTVPMKDSGVEWLGQIPASWSLARLKHLVTGVEQGWSPLCDNRQADDHEWGVLKVGCVNGMEFDGTENKALPSALDPLEDLEIASGDILMSRANTRQLLGSAALVRIVRPRLLLCDKLYRIRVRSELVLPSFLVHAFSSSLSRFQFEREATGASASMQNISQQMILELLVPCPPPEEQQRIVEVVERDTAQLSGLIERIGGAVDRLKELRTALISAAVTGKIDVRAA